MHYDLPGQNVLSSVLYTIYGYAKNYTKPTIFYTNYMLYEDAIIIRVIRRKSFSVFFRRFSHLTDLRSFWKYKFLWSISNEKHPKIEIGYTVYGKVTIAIHFPEAINTFR